MPPTAGSSPPPPPAYRPVLLQIGGRRPSAARARHRPGCGRPHDAPDLERPAGPISAATMPRLVLQNGRGPGCRAICRRSCCCGCTAIGATCLPLVERGQSLIAPIRTIESLYPTPPDPRGHADVAAPQEALG